MKRPIAKPALNMPVNAHKYWKSVTYIMSPPVRHSYPTNPSG